MCSTSTAETERPTRSAINPKRGTLCGAEVDVVAGQSTDEGQLQHLREPQRPKAGATNRSSNGASNAPWCSVSLTSKAITVTTGSSSTD
jgi:hypothetical protein